MKLKPEFITYVTGGDQLLVSASGSFHGMIRSNRTAAFLIDCLKEETTREDLIAAMEAKYDAPLDALTRDVDKVISTLRAIGALDE